MVVISEMKEGLRVNYHCLHISTIPALKHELLNSLLTFSSRKVPTNTDLVWVADAKSLQQRQQYFSSTSDGFGEIRVYAYAFFTF